jgi:large subunit ribosomal protein L35
MGFNDHDLQKPGNCGKVPATVAIGVQAAYRPALPRFDGWSGQYGLPWLSSNVANQETKMPKLKTKSGVKKRFKLTATGKVKHGVAGKRHRLISHNAKYIRQNRGTSVLAEADTGRIKLWAPYGLN